MDVNAIATVMRVTKQSPSLQQNRAFLLWQKAWSQTTCKILMTSLILAGSTGAAIAQTAPNPNWSVQATQTDCSGTTAYSPNGSAGAEVLPCQSYKADLYENWDPSVQGTGDTDIETYAAGYDGDFFYFRFDMRQNWNYDNSGVSRNYYLDVEADSGTAGGDNRADFFVRYDPSALHVGTTWQAIGQSRGFIYGDENNDVGCGNLGLNDAKGCSTGFKQDITLQSSDFYVRIIGDKIEFAIKASLFGSKQQIRSRGYATQTSTLSPDKLYWHDANDNTDLSSFRFDYSAGGDPVGWIVSGVGAGTPTTVSISGKVWQDKDGSANNTFTNINTNTETGTNAGGLNAILVDSTGKVIATTVVAADGTYTFSNITGNQNNVTIRLSTTAGTVGQTAPATSLPTGWVNTSPLEQTAFNIATTNITGKDFGIEQPPNTNDATAASQTNPGGTTTVQVPALSGTDPEDGTLGTGKSFKIVTLPTNGTLSYNGTTVTTGQVITNYDPTLLRVDPNDGAVTVSFTYAAVDAAGKVDATPATVSVPFTAPVVTNAKVLLVKRITAINSNSSQNPNDGTVLNVFVEDSGTTDDNNANWPERNTYLRGAINGGLIKPNDEIEYTVYFLNTQNNAQTVTACDLVPDHQTFVATGYNNVVPHPSEPGATLSDTGIGLALNSTTLPTLPTAYLTNLNDSDRGRYYPSNASDTPSTCQKFDNLGNVISSGSAANTNGAVVIEIIRGAEQLPPATAPGTPPNSYGFIRFKTQVN
jgi:hypothetical protein